MQCIKVSNIYLGYNQNKAIICHTRFPIESWLSCLLWKVVEATSNQTAAASVAAKGRLIAAGGKNYHDDSLFWVELVGGGGSFSFTSKKSFNYFSRKINISHIRWQFLWMFCWKDEKPKLTFFTSQQVKNVFFSLSLTHTLSHLKFLSGKSQTRCSRTWKLYQENFHFLKKLLLLEVQPKTFYQL